jgi:hypothetical protein
MSDKICPDFDAFRREFFNTLERLEKKPVFLKLKHYYINNVDFSQEYLNEVISFLIDGRPIISKIEYLTIYLAWNFKHGCSSIIIDPTYDFDIDTDQFIIIDYLTQTMTLSEYSDFEYDQMEWNLLHNNDFDEDQYNNGFDEDQDNIDFDEDQDNNDFDEDIVQPTIIEYSFRAQNAIEKFYDLLRKHERTRGIWLGQEQKNILGYLPIDLLKNVCKYI